MDEVCIYIRRKSRFFTLHSHENYYSNNLCWLIFGFFQYFNFLWITISTHLKQVSYQSKRYFANITAPQIKYKQITNKWTYINNLQPK